MILVHAEVERSIRNVVVDVYKGSGGISTHYVWKSYFEGYN